MKCILELMRNMHVVLQFGQEMLCKWKNATNIGSSLGFRTVCKSGISRIKLRESNLPVFFVEEKPVLVGKLLAHFICWLMTTKLKMVRCDCTILHGVLTRCKDTINGIISMLVRVFVLTRCKDTINGIISMLVRVFVLTSHNSDTRRATELHSSFGMGTKTV